MSNTSTANNNNVGITTDDQTDVQERRLKGEFVRGVSSARNWISSSPESKYPPANNRYHLYVAYNCPWCHRVLLARSIMGLEEVITVDVVYPNRSNEDDKPSLGPNLWKFEPDGQVGQNKRHISFQECTNDTIHNQKYIKQIYELSDIKDQKSVPILYDKQTNTVVNNESSEIIRMFATSGMKEYAATHKKEVDLFPTNKSQEITKLNDWIYTDIANGSYKAGFSSNQDVYETAFYTYFNALDQLNTILENNKFLTGSFVTEADIRLFPPLYRHDPIYYNRFKLNAKYLWQYKHIWRWMVDMVNLDGMDPVTNSNYLAHCKQGYFGRTGNGTIPIGPIGYPECYHNLNWTGGCCDGDDVVTTNDDNGGANKKQKTSADEE